ncbi:MAG: hypothetical protein RLY86_1255 [Pseudomonadota bacterium]|jgi:hypothetical protein
MITSLIPGRGKGYPRINPFVEEPIRKPPGIPLLPGELSPKSD